MLKGTSTDVGARQAKLITVHGRTREQKGPLTGTKGALKGTGALHEFIVFFEENYVLLEVWGDGSM